MFRTDISDKSLRFQKAFNYLRYASTSSLYLAYDLFDEYKDVVAKSDMKQSDLFTDLFTMMEFAAMMYILGHAEGIHDERRKKRQ